MKKPLLALVVMIVFLLGIGFAKPVTADTQSFSDVKTHWAKTYITNLTNLGYLKGYPDKTFKPDKYMSRAEFTTALMSCMQINVTTSSSGGFSDTGSHWAKNYIGTAVKQGIIELDEYPQGLYEPDTYIQRSEASAMLVRALGKDPSEGSTSFSDADQVQKSMYRAYIKTAYDSGLISGFTDGTFQPFRDMTRAQVCTVLTKFLDLYGTTTPPVITPSNGVLKTVSIGDNLYTVGSNPITFKYVISDININSLSVTNDALLVNGSYVFALNSSTNNPDIIVNNIRYAVSKMVASGDKLIISSTLRKINLLQIGGKGYNSDYVKLYINSANSENYLSDMEIVDETTVRINAQTYTLGKDKITIDAQNTFYDIKKITITSDNVIPLLYETDPVVFRGLYLTNISAIFAGTTTLDLSKISRIDFVIDGQRYRSSELTMDASANFTINREVFKADEVTIIIDDMYYQINNVQVYEGKFIFYLQETTATEFVVFNSVYRDYADIKIIKDSVVYDMDQVLVISLNSLRIGGKRYILDSTIKCRVDGKLWDITSIDWDNTRQATIIKATASTTGSLLNQPTKYIFYDDNDRKLQDGTDDTVTIYANSKWITFDQILIPDPASFSYNGANYNLIGSQVSLDGNKYEIYDTAWRGSDQVMLLYLE